MGICGLSGRWFTEAMITKRGTMKDTEGRGTTPRYAAWGSYSG